MINGDVVRADSDAVAFVRAFFEAGTPVAAICHAPSVLTEADVVRGRQMTSWPWLQTGLRNAGAGGQPPASSAAAGAITSSVPANSRTASSRTPSWAWSWRCRQAATPATSPVTVSGAATRAA